jgi:hypothetical protein
MSIKLKDTIYDLINKSSCDELGDNIISTYYKKSGGTITGKVTVSTSNFPQIICNSTTADKEANIRFEILGVNKGYVGYIPSQGTFIFNSTAVKYLAINDSGEPHLSGTLLWHQGNLTKVSQLNNDAGYITVSSIPSTLPNPQSLTIKLNGTSQGAYNGSFAKEINITPSSIGASASHSHPYLSTGGGTLTGPITFNYSGGCIVQNATTGDNKWAFINLKSGTTSEWHIGTLGEVSTSVNTYIGESNAFEIRTAKDNYSGISIRNNTSSYGKLVINTPSGECSIGFKNDNSSTKDKPKWVFGIQDAGNNFGVYSRSLAKWVTSWQYTTGNIYIGTGTASYTYKVNISGSLGAQTANFSSANYPQIVCNSTTANVESNIRFDIQNTAKGYIGYIPTHGTFIFNCTSSKYLAVNDSGIPHLSGSTIWHAGNDGSDSGLDADLLDGKHASSFSLTTHNHDGVYSKIGHTHDSSDHSHTNYVLKSGDVVSGPLRFERPTSSNNNYNEGARFNIGGAGSWAGFTIGNAAGSTEGNSEGAYAFLVNNKKFYIRHKDTDFLTVDTSKNILWNPGLFAIVTGQTECGIRFRIASSSGDFVGRYSNYVSLFNANNPNSEIKIHDSNNEVTIGTYNQKNRLIVNGIGDSTGYYSQIYATSPNEASITFSNNKLQSDPNFFTVGMTHSDNIFWVYSGKKAGRILVGDGNGYIRIPNRLAIGADAAPSYALQVSGEGYFSNTLYINKSSTTCALSLVHTSSSYPWCWQRFVSNSQEWHVGVCSDSTSGTNRLNAGAFEIRGRGQSDEGIFIRQETSSFGKLVVANNSNTETSIGYLNTNHSNTYPVWTVGCGIGTGVQTFGWWYQPANGSGGDCKMYLDNGGNLFLDGTIYIGGQAITFVT